MRGRQRNSSLVSRIQKIRRCSEEVFSQNQGDILIFGSYLAHRSGANGSSKDRRAIYATYNCAAEGNLHDQYYADRREVWPATHMRKNGLSYEEGRARYAFGSPMLSVDTEVNSAA